MYEVRAEANSYFETGIVNVWYAACVVAYYSVIMVSDIQLLYCIYTWILTANSTEWIWDDQCECRQEDQKQTVAEEVYEVAQLTKLQPLVVQQTADQRVSKDPPALLLLSLKYTCMHNYH